MKISSRRRCLWGVVLLACGVWAGCGKKKSDDGDPAPVLNGACTGDGQGCDGAVLVGCLDGIWTGVQDCSGSGLTCGQSAPGTYECLSASLGTCDLQGQGVGGMSPADDVVQYAHWDDDIFGLYTILSVELDVQSQAKTHIAMWAAPDLEVGQEYSFAGVNSKPETAEEVTLMGMTTGPTLFVADSGTVVFQSLPGLGGTLQATLTDVSMREFERDEQGATIDVAGGARWCLDSFPIDALVIRYTCDWYELGPYEDYMKVGEMVCGDTVRIGCRESTVLPEASGLDEVYLHDNCADSGLTCADSDPLGAAVCQ